MVDPAGSFELGPVGKKQNHVLLKIMSFFYLKMSDKFSTISKASHFCVETKKEYNQFSN